MQTRELAMQKQQKLEKEIAALRELTREELIGRWVAIYGCPPPSGVRRELLLYATAWHLQAKRLGGFSPEARRLLKKAVEKVRLRMIGISGQEGTAIAAVGNWGGTPPTATAIAGKRSSCDREERRPLRPGARLLRDWNGSTHIIDVTESGFLFEEKSYRSLSAIARQITGAQWSGPRFFGL